MANLDKSNVVNGNTISASDITALYDTLTGANTANNINILGGSNNFAGTSSRASTLLSTGVGANVNYAVPFINTSSSDYSSFLYDTSNGILYNPSSNLLTVTSSFAVTSSYAESAASPISVLNKISPDSQTPSPLKAWYPFGGIMDTTSVASVDLFTVFGFTPVIGFGGDIIVTANIIGTGGPGIAINPVLTLGPPATLAFDGTTSGDVVMYQGWYSV